MSAVAEIVQRLVSTDPSRTEADIQSDIKSLLLDDSLNLEPDQVVHLEQQTGDGTRRRLDVAVGHCVIEVKKSLASATVLKDAVEQLTGYVRTRVEEHERRYVGVLSDGREWILFDLIENELVEISRVSASVSQPDRLTNWLEAILATEVGVKPTPDEIRGRLGAESPAYLLNKRELTALYVANSSNPEISLKRELWAKLLRTAFGSAFKDDVDRFVNHTLLVVTAEAIAHAVMGIDVSRVGTLNARDLVTGHSFDEANLFGVVEADFFDWVVEVEGGDAFVRNLADRIARFDWSEVEHDVLKHLYESVIPQSERADLGEYYTPDWLADRVVEATVEHPLSQRVLDPSCGSGTFLFHAIRAYLDAADADSVPNGKALAGLTERVIGVDVHPVSVTLARVTYLLAIGAERLASDDRPPLSVPVYLGDSLQWEQHVDLFHSDDRVSISTAGSDLVEGGASLADADLVFPRSVLVDAARFDRIVSAMADAALDVSKTETKTLLGRIVKTFALSPDEASVIGPTLATMRALHQAQRNHIWGFYVRNLIRPIWLSEPSNRVDVLIGNPPWLRYSKMTKGMQSRYLALAKPRGLLSGPLGASSRDLSTLFVVRAVEMYLKSGGRFSFVMPHGTMTRKPHTGFRAGRWSPVDTTSGRLVVAFDQSWDLSQAPTGFPMVSCVVNGKHLAAESASAVPMSKDVQLWSAKFSDANQSWTEVADQFKITEHVIVPIDSDDETPTSPYKRAFRQGAVFVPRVLFMADELPAGPLGVGAGRLRVTARRSSQEKEPWKLVIPPDRVVERQFFHQAHFGETVVPYGLLASRGVLVPVTDEVLSRAQIDDFPDLAKWWSIAEDLWDSNKSEADSSSLLDRLDFMKQTSSQFPLATHRVVYTKAGNSLNAARISNNTALIDQKLYWGAVSSVAEAQYLVGIINSETLLDRVKPLQALGLFGTRDFDKAVFAVPFQPYDGENDLHVRLAAEVALAERIVAGMSLPDSFTKARRGVRSKLKDEGLAERIEDLVNELLPVVG